MTIEHPGYDNGASSSGIKKTIVLILAIMIVSDIVVGSVVYLWQQNISGVQSEIAAQAVRSELQKNINDLETTLATTQSSARTTEAELQKEVVSLKAQIASLQKEKDALQSSIQVSDKDAKTVLTEYYNSHIRRLNDPNYKENLDVDPHYVTTSFANYIQGLGALAYDAILCSQDSPDRINDIQTVTESPELTKFVIDLGLIDNSVEVELGYFDGRWKIQRVTCPPQPLPDPGM